MISIIVPVYNKEAEVGKCIRSILNQTMREYECLLVDDGSTDASGKICDQYAERDGRIKVIHKSNGGLSDARNVGMRYASGDVIGFIDSDDYIAPTYLEILDSMLTQSEKIDMAICATEIEEEGRGRSWQHFEEAEGGKEHCQATLTSQELLLSMLYDGGVSVSAWGKLYRRSLLSNCEFPQGRLYEDVEWSIMVAQRVKLAAATNDKLYHYVMNSNSITHNTDERVFDRYFLAISAQKRLRRTGNMKLARAANRYAVYHALSVLRSDYPITSETQSLEKEMLRFIRTYSREVLLDSRASFRDKLAILLLTLGKRFYRFSWRVYSNAR